MTGDLHRAVAGADVVVAAVGLTSDLEGEEMPVKVEGFAAATRPRLICPPISAPAGKRQGAGQAAGGGGDERQRHRPELGQGQRQCHRGGLVSRRAGRTGRGQVLSGEANPAGRLPLTFYHTLADLPAFDDYAMAGRTYRYFTGKPVYPFGYGLSYTSFAYDGLTVTPVEGDAAKGLHVTAQLRNTGPRAGEEVVQVYLRFPQAPGVPNIALRGFQRVALKPGEARQVSFDLPRDLSSVSPMACARCWRGLSAQPWRRAAGAGPAHGGDRLHRHPWRADPALRDPHHPGAGRPGDLSCYPLAT
jgi:beta-glucosidase